MRCIHGLKSTLAIWKVMVPPEKVRRWPEMLEVTREHSVVLWDDGVGGESRTCPVRRGCVLVPNECCS